MNKFWWNEVEDSDKQKALKFCMNLRPRRFIGFLNYMVVDGVIIKQAATNERLEDC